MTSSTATSPVSTTVSGSAGIITLTRSKALNALTQEMVDLIAEALERFRGDDNVKVVVLRGEGERAFCAGGDVVMLYHEAKSHGDKAEHFWRTEYELNLAINRYPKPIVALMHGIVLGGGIGISAHASHRVVTDSTKVGMPEVGIGFVPDVGGTFLLSHTPGHLGRHLALTAAHVGPAEALRCGMADVYVPEQDLDALVERLAETGDVSAIESFARDCGPGFADSYDIIESAYDAETVEDILDNLDKDGSEFAQDAAKRIRRGSPLALKVTLAALNNAADLDLAQALNQEYRTSLNMHANPNFVEGVRAQLVDKDRNPSWIPATLEEVTHDDVAAILGPVVDERFGELGLS
ncbi:enoyl-CoA hydratase/isomerase family protein [Corynebacterium aquilae]|uniref:3-hydroxyisobutyryl-CoA hydrolase n=1 Tax=Corynebacterium aquilae DSM 44791 TaxID=1431546 RepID=A0A1L7CHT1_9CORY|nr:enoyl-CoA hydratase/isomerase family protein [Corynebacterium aquilae]APT85404.1 hypothetical protein CAQU_10485 [Corynebacterium aquilae DSM 44791]